MNKRMIVFFGCALILILGACQTQPLRVPEKYFTIQRAIDRAIDGDVIIVSPGTYTENIDFKGKNITLQSTDPDDPEVVAATTPDGTPLPENAKAYKQLQEKIEEVAEP